MIYFDHNATTPMVPAAREAWLRAADEFWHNPSAPYRAAGRARNRLEDCRERLAGLLGCPVGELIFNSGATEANNAVMAHYGRGAEGRQGVLLAPVEHPCVREAARAAFGERVSWLGVDSEGRVDPAEVEQRIRDERPALVSVMAANNETGVVQPFREIAERCRAFRVPFHCDAAQWFGKYPAAALSGCDLVSGSAHKFGGSKGTGFLRVSARFSGFQGQRGGGHEHRRRAGTEDLPGVAAMVAALEACEADGSVDIEERASRRDAFESAVREAVPGARAVSTGADRLWNTSMLVMPRHANHRWVLKLDRDGFAVSTGSACATADRAPSHVLAALGISPDEAKRAVRVSAGGATGSEDWRGLAEVFGGIWERWDESDSGQSLTNVISVEP